MINQELKLWDPTIKEFKWMVEKHPEFFERIGNWFYLANDKNTSQKEGYVLWSERKKLMQDDSTRCASGAAVIELTPNAKYPLTHGMREKKFVDFKLAKEGESAFFAKIKFKEQNRYFLVIKNSEESFCFPFSKNNSASYSVAKDEEGCLPYYVNSGKILKLLPREYIKMTGIDVLGVSK